jgi:hypothetical protein
MDLISGSFLRKALLGVNSYPLPSEQKYKVERAVDAFLRAYQTRLEPEKQKK